MALVNRAPYEADQHAPIALKEGITQAQLDALQDVDAALADAVHFNATERAVFADPHAVKHYLQLHLAARAHEVFAVVFLDAQNKLLAMEIGRAHV